MTRLPGNTEITVCDKCLRASCWHGEFMCDESQNAGTTEKTVDELDALHLENPEHYSAEKIAAVCGLQYAALLIKTASRVNHGD